MRHRTGPALVLAALALAWAPDHAAAQAPDPDGFGLTTVHALHVELSPKEWAKMQEVKGGMMMFGGPPKQPADKPDKPGTEPPDRHKGGGFGLEFPWARAELTAEGKTFKNVGIRYKGNSSYVAAGNSLKRNFKIDLERFDENQAFHGRRSLTLNAGAMDPSRLREALAYAVFRAAGVPAPRTAFAEVTLTVPGKCDNELLGL
jgi:hypothetical protein